tara:strand:+ start:6014 stop:7891 length:1878 start_codon:yes stop_codon:yes gene_type:complete
MSWDTGIQNSRARPEDFNQFLLNQKGFIKEEEAKLLLYEFLRENITFSTDLLSGVKLFPFQHMAVKAMFETDYFLGIWSRGMSKSFTTGIYAFLDAILNQGVETGILSKSFRQSKLIFKKIEDIANKPGARFLAQCINKTSKTNDQWTMEIGRSKIHALPLGDGEKLRGFRFQRIIIDEFLLMPERIYNEVIIPFLSVVENPTQREDLDQAENKLIAQGKMRPEDKYVWPNNKLIALSSASYKFEYLYKVYQNFENLILHGQEDRKASDAHRVIMHFSYDMAPKMLYDQNLIDQARASMSQSQYDREFGAMFTDDSSGYFKVSTMARCTVDDGENPSIEVKGAPGAKYILAFDPSWAESESSDDFAIQVLKLDDGNKWGTVVHSYALSGAKLKDHIAYFHYLWHSFNIVAIIGDYMGGVQFLNAVNESDVFKKEKIQFGQLETDFSNPVNYNDSIKTGKLEYNLDTKKICLLQKPTSGWIRLANELLQANFDHRRIWFGGRALGDTYHQQINKKIPIKSLKFDNGAEALGKSSNQAMMIDFVEHQYDMINLTKTECALVQITTSPQGHQTFDLPQMLKRQTGPDKTRKDSYSALVLGNWMIKVYYDMMNANIEEVQSTFTPMFIK